MQETKLLIVYATSDGQTAKIARRIADVAGSEPDVECRLFDVREVHPEAIGWCNRIVLAAFVHFGRHPRAMLRFVRGHRDALQAMPSAFVSVSGASASPKGEADSKRYVAMFLRKSGWTPMQVERVAGATLYTRYNPLVRFVMRRAALAAGSQDLDITRDFEYTDWDQVDRFARGFVSVAAARVA